MTCKTTNRRETRRTRKKKGEDKGREQSKWHGKGGYAFVTTIVILEVAFHETLSSFVSIETRQAFQFFLLGAQSSVSLQIRHFRESKYSRHSTNVPILGLTHEQLFQIVQLTPEYSTLAALSGFRKTFLKTNEYSNAFGISNLNNNEVKRKNGKNKK